MVLEVRHDCPPASKGTRPPTSVDGVAVKAFHVVPAIRREHGAPQVVARVLLDRALHRDPPDGDLEPGRHDRAVELTARETIWLVDKTALTRLATDRAAAEWAERIERGLVRIATVTRLELGYSARSGKALRSALDQPPLASMLVEYLAPHVEDRAVEVQLLLADRGHHRAPSVPDLLVAAAAELGGLTVLHSDKDFE